MTSLRQRVTLVTFIGLMAVPLFGQGRTEVGALGLVTSYLKVDVSNSERSGKVGPTWGPAAGFVVGQSMGDHWGGEFRYIFFQNDIQLESGGESTDFSSQSHAVHYDVFYYFNDFESRVRPYVAAGFGIKNYRGTGTEQSFQPLSDLVLLTNTSQTVFAGDFGGGVKVRFAGNGILRMEFRDYITKTPDKIIAESLDSEVGEILHHWAPLFGISWTF
jgi:hypothetical protein